MVNDLFKIQGKVNVDKGGTLFYMMPFLLTTNNE